MARCRFESRGSSLVLSSGVTIVFLLTAGEVWADRASEMKGAIFSRDWVVSAEGDSTSGLKRVLSSKAPRVYARRMASEAVKIFWNSSSKVGGVTRDSRK